MQTFLHCARKVPNFFFLNYPRRRASFDSASSASA